MKTYKLHRFMVFEDVEERLQKLDFENVLRAVVGSEAEYNFESEIKRILKLRCPKFGQNLIFKQEEAQNINLDIPSTKKALHAETLAFFEPCFRTLSFDDFYFTFIAMLLGKTVIFVSKSLQKLSSSM